MAPLITNRLAKIWKAPVRKKRPPFCRVKSWQKNRNRAKQLKMMDRIMRACTAWIHSPADAGIQYWPLVEEQFCQRSEVPDCPVVHTLTIVETNSRTSAATCRKMIPRRSSSIFTQCLDKSERHSLVSGAVHGPR